MRCSAVKGLLACCKQELDWQQLQRRSDGVQHTSAWMVHGSPGAAADAWQSADSAPLSAWSAWCSSGDRWCSVQQILAASCRTAVTTAHSLAARAAALQSFEVVHLRASPPCAPTSESSEPATSLQPRLVHPSRTCAVSSVPTSETAARSPIAPSHPPPSCRRPSW